MVSVCWTLVVALSFRDIVPESLMEFIKIRHKIPGSGRGNVAFGVNEDSGIIAFVDVEWRDTCSFTRGIVVGEFGERKESGPVFLLVRNVVS